jgi:hypothetical protein
MLMLLALEALVPTRGDEYRENAPTVLRRFEV